MPSLGPGGSRLRVPLRRVAAAEVEASSCAEQVMGDAMKMIAHRIDRAVKRQKKRDAAKRKQDAFKRAIYFERIRRRNKIVVED